MVFQNYALYPHMTVEQNLAFGRPSDFEDAGLADGGWGKMPVIASVSARSSVKPGQPIELGVDTRNVHFFDPGSGLFIGHPKATAHLAEHG